MEELEAVQMLLRSIGSSPVNSLSVAHPDVANARACLERLRKSTQRRGWWFNIDYNVVYQKNGVGEVLIPKEITKFVADDVRYVKRGGKVYDAHNQTFRINKNITALKTVRALQWEHMPASLQVHAAYLACAEFISDEVEDPAKEDKYMKLAGIAKVDVDAEDLESSKVNVFHGARVSRARSGQTPYNKTTNLRPNDYS
tara:strand:+ start:1055 stop:1651 length:597 start_codon:yes stop_codon:yes gene_type:complete